jgi:hypothetical protein
MMWSFYIALPCRYVSFFIVCLSVFFVLRYSVVHCTVRLSTGVKEGAITSKDFLVLLRGVESSKLK